MKTKLLVAIGFAAALSTSAMADPSCLQVGQIWNWKALDNQTLIVEDNWHHKYKVSLMGYCPNLTFKERVGFKAVGGFSRLSCLGKGDEVLVRDIAVPSRCPITNVVAYTPEMEKADKAAAAAKARREHTYR